MATRWGRQGFWLRRARGGWVLYPWRALLPFLVLPLLFGVVVVLAWNRRTWDLAEVLTRGDSESFDRAVDDFSDANAAAIDNLLNTDQRRPPDDLPAVDLRVQDRALDLLERAIRVGDPALNHAPGGTKPYVPAKYRDESGAWQRCQIAYRGSTPYHWWPAKPSLRVKLRKKDVRRGRRYVELQRPEDVLALGNMLPEELGRQLDVLGNLSDPVRLFVNGKYRGVYLRTARPGEALAVEQGRLPGTFFKGDVFAPQDPKQLWLTPDAWRVTDPAPQALQAFAAMLRALDEGGTQGKTPEGVASLDRHLDTEAFARWSAVMALTGGVRSDYAHNHVLFWNSYRGRFEPVVWDVNGYGVATRPRMPVDVILQPFQDRLSRDPRWVHSRNQHLQRLLTGVGSADAQRARIEGHLGRMRAALRADAHLATVEAGHGRVLPWPTRRLEEKVTELETWIEQRLAYLQVYLSLALYHAQPDPRRPGNIRVQVQGTVALSVELPDGRARLLYPGLTEELFQGDQQRGPIVRPYALPAPRWYSLPGPQSRLRFRNAITGAPARATPRAAPAKRTRTIPPRLFPPRPTDPVVLGPGTITVGRDIITGPGQTLTIKAGTTLQLDPGVGIYARGKVIIDGRPDAPVTLEPAGDEPWACLGLSGPDTAGSRLRHLTVRGGSLGTDGSVRFKGMVNAYGCPDLELVGCRFVRNRASDDAINLAQSRIRIRDCVFVDAPADGLDLDRCRGVIEGSRFERCGNDGLDLMTCRVIVRDCVFRDCGDKGISVGEATRVLVRETRIESCAIGLQVKDASAAVVLGGALERNTIGVHLYMKKWRYGLGGAALLSGTRLSGGDRSVSVEERSRLFLHEVETADLGVGERVNLVDEVPAEWDAIREGTERDAR